MKNQSFPKEPLIKSLHHHAGESLCRHVVSQYQHLVTNCIDWILAPGLLHARAGFARMTKQIIFRLNQGFPK